MHRVTVFCLVIFVTAMSSADGILFEVRRLDTWRSEAVAVADFDGDGHLDVATGPYLYLAPDFRPRKIRDVKSPVDANGNGYQEDFMNHPLDVNGDGRIDIVSADVRGQPMWWNENSLPSDGLWPRHDHDRTITFSETGYMVDLDGDGRCESIVTDPLKGIYTAGRGTLLQRDENLHGFGTGCGDLLGTGTNGLVAGNHFWEQLPNGWKRHPLAIEYDGDAKNGLGHRSNVIVFDVNADGRADLIFSSAHKYGIFWFEQLPPDAGKHGSLPFRRHVIDDTWTQAHNPTLADIDGDGFPELIAGKRWMAHCKGDPDADGVCGIWYYDFVPGPNPAFTRRTVTSGGDCTAGLNIVVADMDSDGRPDLVTTSKKGGPWIIYNRGSCKPRVWKNTKSS